MGIYYAPRTSLNVGILSDMVCEVAETRTMTVESKDKLNKIKQNAEPDNNLLFQKIIIRPTDRI